MGKHSRRNTNGLRNTAVASAAAAGAVVAFSPAAQAAEVVVPNTNIRVEVAGLENVPNIAAVPGIEQWVPSLANQGAAPAAPFVGSSASEGQRIVDAAASKIGAPYVWGATGPNAFDCSGLTQWAYGQVGKSIPRTSQAQAAGGHRVGINDLQPGDIVAFYSGATHVGIYTGHGTVVNALTTGTPLSETPIKYMPFHSATRY